jgi:hypothetical protein
MSTCPVSWPDVDGQHSCRHEQGHEKRRHSCVCGSWPGERDNTPHDSPDTSCAEQPVGVEADDGATSPRPVVTAT